MSLLLFFLGEEMPENQISFKTRVKNALIQYAGVYYTQFVCKDYLLISDAFHKQAYYILSAEKDNFLFNNRYSFKFLYISLSNTCFKNNFYVYLNKELVESAVERHIVYINA